MRIDQCLLVFSAQLFLYQPRREEVPHGAVRTLNLRNSLGIINRDEAFEPDAHPWIPSGVCIQIPLRT